MNYEVQIDASFAMAGGTLPAEHGVTAPELAEAAKRVGEIHAELQAKDRERFADLYKDTAGLAAVKETAAHFRGFHYDNLVVLGIGGSALGTTALVSALKPPYYNLLSKEARGGAPRIFVMDNVDPVTFAQMLKLCPPERTLYNVISKSGTTSETAAQMFIVFDAIEKALGRDAVAEHVVLTTNPRDVEENAFHRIADAYKCRVLSLPFMVGGRFSVFSSVGMFPAAMLDMDLDGMMEGCRLMDARCQSADLAQNPAYLRAAINCILYRQKGKPMSVMMPYSDALRDIADWYRQLWAESLGKNVGCGPTPIKSLGVTDQHSQLQLYLEGPNDKLINTLEVGEFDADLPIPVAMGFEHLQGKTMNLLMDAEMNATISALHAQSRPVLRTKLPKVTASTVAQVLYMLELETAMAGRLLGINTFDQPGVKLIKDLTLEFLKKQ